MAKRKSFKLLVVSSVLFLLVLTVALIATKRSAAEEKSEEKFMEIIENVEKKNTSIVTREDLEKMISKITDINYVESSDFVVMNVECEITVRPSQFTESEEAIEDLLSVTDLSQKSNNLNDTNRSICWRVSSSSDVTDIADKLKSVATSYSADEWYADTSSIQNHKLDENAISQLNDLFFNAEAEDAVLIDEAIANIQEHMSNLPDCSEEDAVSWITVTLRTE